MEHEKNYNQLANAHNPYQGKMKKALCVCSAGLLRSPTLAWVLSNPPYNFNTRAAGIAKEYALVHTSFALVEWADIIICAEQGHASYIKEILKDIDITNQKKPVYVFDLPDIYRTRDPNLIAIIEEKAKDILKNELT